MAMSLIKGPGERVPSSEGEKPVSVGRVDAPTQQHDIIIIIIRPVNESPVSIFRYFEHITTPTIVPGDQHRGAVRSHRPHK
jgi:glutaredoxin